MSRCKKILSWALVVALTIGVSIAGTIAYFTDEDSAVNVMTVGNVQITQNEQERIDHKNVEAGLQEFTQGQSIVPAADVTGEKMPITVNGYHLNIRTGETYVDKIVSVTNDGVNDAYVRTIFAFPETGEFDTTTDASEQWFHWNGVSDTDTDHANGWMWGNDKSEWPGNAEGWDVVENVEINGKKYDIYVATNKNVLASGSSTSPSLMGFYLDTRVDFNGSNYIFTDKNGKEWNLGDISELDILVLSQACQTEGFEDAWTALDTVFGDVTAATVTKWFDSITVPNIVTTVEELRAALEIGGDIILGADLVVTSDNYLSDGSNYGDGFIARENTAIYLNGYNISQSGGGALFYVENAVMTVEGNGNVVVNKANWIWADAGSIVNVNGGNWLTEEDGNLEGMYAKGGTININGGFFEHPTQTLNKKNNALSSVISVKGGTFVNFDPSDNEKVTDHINDEGNVVASGYKVQKEIQADGKIWFTVISE